MLEKEPLLANCYSASISHQSVLGGHAGKPLLRLISQHLIKGKIEDQTIMGFNLHASAAIEAHDRQGLERTRRYMGRPPLSAERLKLAHDGKRLLLTLKNPWRDGTSKIIITPFALLERLVAIIPPPKKNLIRYHGIFGPNASLREDVVQKGAGQSDTQNCKKISRPGFAKLMARVFEIDVLTCPRCQSPMELISFIMDPKVIKDILKSLKMTTAPPEQIKSVVTVEYEIDAGDLVWEDQFPIP